MSNSPSMDDFFSESKAPLVTAISDIDAIDAMIRESAESKSTAALILEPLRETEEEAEETPARQIPESQRCEQCGGKLANPKIESNSYTHYCDRCKHCPKCQNYVGGTDFNWCEQYRQPLIHLLCLAPEIRLAVEFKKIEITQKELDFLNAVRLTFIPDMERSVETNMHRADIQGLKLITDMSLEEKYVFLRNVEAVAATVSIAIKKDRKTIELELNKKERQKYESAMKASKQDALNAEEARAYAKLPKLEKKKLNQFEKAVASLTSLGLSQEAAEEAVKQQMNREKAS